VSAHEPLYATYTDGCAGFSADELATQSLCPDWDVRGVIAHAIGVEAVLDGWEPSTESPPPFGKMGEFAATVADLAPSDLATTVAEVTGSRLGDVHGRRLPGERRLGRSDGWCAGRDVDELDAHFGPDLTRRRLGERSAFADLLERPLAWFAGS
jgi:hypothetical protein